MNKLEKEEIARLAAKYAVAGIREVLTALLSPEPSAQKPQEADEYIKSDEVMRIMGWKPATLYKHIAEIPHHRQGNKCYFLRSKVLQFKKQYFNLH